MCINVTNYIIIVKKYNCRFEKCDLILNSTVVEKNEVEFFEWKTFVLAN